MYITSTVYLTSKNAQQLVYTAVLFALQILSFFFQRIFCITFWLNLSLCAMPIKGTSMEFSYECIRVTLGAEWPQCWPFDQRSQLGWRIALTPAPLMAIRVWCCVPSLGVIEHETAKKRSTEPQMPQTDKATKGQALDRRTITMPTVSRVDISITSHIRRPENEDLICLGTMLEYIELNLNFSSF